MQLQDFQELPSKPVDIFCRLQVSGHFQDESLGKGETGRAVWLGVDWTVRAWMRWFYIRKHPFWISLKPKIFCQTCARFTSRALSPFPPSSCSASLPTSLPLKISLLPPVLFVHCFLDASSSIFSQAVKPGLAILIQVLHLWPLLWWQMLTCFQMAVCCCDSLLLQLVPGITSYSSLCLLLLPDRTFED